MARYRYRPDGMIDAETSAGFLPMPAPADEDLRDLGYLLDSGGVPDLGPDERLALNSELPPEGTGGATEVNPMLKSIMDAGAPPPAQAHAPPAPGGGFTFDELDETGRKAPASVSDSLRPNEEDIPTGGQGGAPSLPPADDKPTYRTTPAYDQKATWQIEKGIPIDPKAEQEALDRDIKQEFLIREKGDREAAKADQALDATDRALGMQERQIGESEIKLAALRRDFDKRQKLIDEERTAVDELKVDPDRIYSGAAGTFAKILAGISIIAGGALMGRQGRSSNPGLDAVNAAIDRDIALQKDEIANRRAGLKGRETELERLMATYGNPEIAERELRDRQMSLAMAYLKRTTQDSPEDVQIRAAQQVTDYQAKRAAERAETERASMDREVQNWKHTPAQTVQTGGAKPKTAAQEKDERGRQVIVDGQILYVNDESKGKIVEEAVATADSKIEALGELRRLIKSGGSKDQIDSLVANINAGLPAGDDKSGSGRLGSAQSLLGKNSDALERIQATEENIKRERNKAIAGRVYRDPGAKTPYKPGIDPSKVKRE